MSWWVGSVPVSRWSIVNHPPASMAATLAIVGWVDSCRDATTIGTRLWAIVVDLVGVHIQLALFRYFNICSGAMRSGVQDRAIVLPVVRDSRRDGHGHKFLHTSHKVSLSLFIKYFTMFPGLGFINSTKSIYRTDSGSMSSSFSSFEKLGLSLMKSYFSSFKSSPRA